MRCTEDKQNGKTREGKEKHAHEWRYPSWKLVANGSTSHLQRFRLARAALAAVHLRRRYGPPQEILAGKPVAAGWPPVCRRRCGRRRAHLLFTNDETSQHFPVRKEESDSHSAQTIRERPVQ
jgi:hypothetical protein